MSLFKFSFLFLFLLSSFKLHADSESFTAQQCLEAVFETEVRHKGQPLGFAENILSLKKENCTVQIGHEKMRFLKKAWEVDVCRGPIHIKSGAGAVDVARRSGECSKTNDSNFCEELRTIESILQNDGLIFAEGKKEDLSSPHGMVYCSYLLIQKYLRDGVILSEGQKVESFSLDSGKFDEELSEEKSTSPVGPSDLSRETQGSDEELFPETDELGDF